MTVKEWLAAVGNVQKMAKREHWTYGDSHALPPCADGFISCDRLEARALWDEGRTDQPKGGITVVNMESYLTNWGWHKITKAADLLPGDIVLMKQNGESKATWRWHTFVLTEYNAKTQICSKYDEGSQTRIDSTQPFKNVPLNEWKGARSFYCGFRMPAEVKGTKYTIRSTVKKNYVIDIKGGSLQQKAEVQIHTANGTEAQLFVIEKVKADYYRIINVKSGLVLDAKGGKARNGQPIWQYKWNKTNAQLWKLRMNEDGSITFLSAIDERYAMDLKSAKAVNGQQIQLYKDNGTKAQKWKIEK